MSLLESVHSVHMGLWAISDRKIYILRILQSSVKHQLLESSSIPGLTFQHDMVPRPPVNPPHRQFIDSEDQEFTKFSKTGIYYSLDASSPNHLINILLATHP